MIVASRALFASRSVEWQTPRALFQRLNREFSFTLDVCATATNRKCARFFTARQDGLHRRWSGRCWMNPPYGRAIGKWIKKALSESETHHATVVALIPARTD